MRGGKSGGDSPPFALGAMGGSQGGGSPPCQGPRQHPNENFWSLISSGRSAPIVLCMVLYMVLGYDGFRPLIFCVDPVKGTTVMF